MYALGSQPAAVVPMPAQDPIVRNAEAGDRAGLIYHPSRGVYSTVEMRTLPDAPDDQVAETIAVMCQYALEDAGTPEMQRACEEAMRESPGAHPIQCVWDYVRSRMSFVYDRDWGAPVEEATGVPVIEVVTRPRDMHTWWQGDCDDYMTYAVCMLLTLGVPMAYATVAADERAPDEYTHVYLVAYPGEEGRTPLDFSHGQSIGWEVGNRFGKMREWPVTQASAHGRGADLLGLAMAGVGFWLAYGRGRQAA